jgi:transposase
MHSALCLPYQGSGFNTPNDGLSLQRFSSETGYTQGTNSEIGKQGRMRSYSLDLRERVIQAWQEGQRQDWIAETFRVSLSTLKEWVKRFRETGSAAPLPRGHEQPLIKSDQARAVQALVDRMPDATLEDYCTAWEQETGQRVSAPTMCRALQRFDRPRKKNGRGCRAR